MDGSPVITTNSAASISRTSPCGHSRLDGSYAYISGLQIVKVLPIGPPQVLSVSPQDIVTSNAPVVIAIQDLGTQLTPSTVQLFFNETGGYTGLEQSLRGERHHHHLSAAREPAQAHYECRHAHFRGQFAPNGLSNQSV